MHEGRGNVTVEFVPNEVGEFSGLTVDDHHHSICSFIALRITVSTR